MYKLVLKIIKNRKMILDLAKSDFKKRFVGSFFGVIWMFVQPLATVIVYTIIFQVGFRSVSPITDVPYTVWLIVGIVPWFYFQEGIIQTTNCLNEYNYLVKKLVFDVDLLPVIKLLSSLMSHFCFVIIMFFIIIITKVPLTINMLMIFILTILNTLFILSISYFTSAVNVFFRDMSQIVSIILQFGIWMAPIMYDESLFMGKSKIITLILKLNPFHFIVKSYRHFLLNEPFDNILKFFIYFVFVVLVIFSISYKLFLKLKEHFADVL